MRSGERGISSENRGGETYNTERPKATMKKIAKNKQAMEQFQKAAEEWANDIFESGRIEEKIGPEDKVLYIGAGSGHVPKYIEQKTGATVIKMDIDNLRAPDTKDDKFALGNARHLPVQDSSLDIVCLFDILHHTMDQEEILQEAMRVLKPGGKCLIMEDTKPEEFQKGLGMTEKMMGKMDDVFNRQPKGTNPHNYHSISDWELILYKEGFQVDANDTTSWYWGPSDFLGASRESRPDHRTTMRPFEATMFDARKPEEQEEEKDIQ